MSAGAATAASRAAEGPVLRSALNPAAEGYLANREAQLRVLAELNEQIELAKAGGGAAGQRVADVDALDQVAREIHAASLWS